MNKIDKVTTNKHKLRPTNDVPNELLNIQNLNVKMKIL